MGKFKFEHRKINGGTNSGELCVNLIQINTVNKRVKLKIVSIASSLKKKIYALEAGCQFRVYQYNV